MGNNPDVERPKGAQSQDSQSEDARKDEDVDVPPATKKPSILLRLWTRSGLSPFMLILMMKMALPPTISLAIYENSKVAAFYSTQGYLIAIISVLSLAIMPRSRFIQTILLDVISACTACAMGLLQIYCSVKARQHTTKRPSSNSNGPSPGA